MMCVNTYLWLVVLFYGKPLCTLLQLNISKSIYLLYRIVDYGFRLYAERYARVEELQLKI